jgi:hypothetical protein
VLFRSVNRQERGQPQSDRNQEKAKSGTTGKQQAKAHGEKNGGGAEIRLFEDEEHRDQGESDQS